MSISSAPRLTASVMSESRTFRFDKPLGKAPATLATLTEVPAVNSAAWSTISG